MAQDLDFLFNPRSVAVIGASDNPLKWGNWISKSLLESSWEGNVYLVNAKGSIVCGKETYRTISDIGEPVDLALIGIPAKFVPDAIRECVKKGIKGIIIITAGFAETGKEGKKLEKELVETARMGGSRIVGPNCAGIYNSVAGLNATIVSFLRGPFTLISQSGNFGLNLNFFAKKRGLGFSKWISFGNQADILFHEYLDYVKDDPNTRVILMYMEGLKNGREFLEVAKETTRSKPVIVLKTGTSAAGTRSAASHTGALAGSNGVYNAAFKQAGIIRVDNSYELLDVGEALAKCPLPKGNRIAILSDGGGDATMAADTAERESLEIPSLSKETQEKLSEVIPIGAVHSLKNPVDFASEADLWCFANCSKVLLEDVEIDGVVICGGFGSYKDTFPGFENIEEEIAPVISQLQRRYNKPIILESNFFLEKPKALEILSEQGVPVYGNVEIAMKCMSSLVQHRKYLDSLREDNEEPVCLSTDRSKRIKMVIGKAKDAHRMSLVETEARSILKEYDLPVSDFKLAKNKEEAIKIAKGIGYPVVMKIVSPNIIHKSDAGGVKLNIKNEEEVLKAFSEVINNAKIYSKEAEIHGVIITPMEDKGIETVIGMTRDNTFGPTVMFGLGGIFVEVLKDVTFRVVPVTKRDAYEMIRQIKGFPVLGGVRGQKAADIDALANIIREVSVLAIENPDIRELDLNPVFAFENGASIVDARIILR